MIDHASQTIRTNALGLDVAASARRFALEMNLSGIVRDLNRALGQIEEMNEHEDAGQVPTPDIVAAALVIGRLRREVFAGMPR